MSEKKHAVTRRKFLKNSVAGTGVTTGWHVLSNSRRVLGANDRVRLGFIGTGNRGSQLLEAAVGIPGVELAALCDVYDPFLSRIRDQVEKSLLESLGGRIPRMGESLDSRTTRFKDFRKLLEKKDIDAIIIATPDHWHAVQTIAALDAGKDVYVEKPLSLTILEGRKMVEAAARTSRVVQVGLQRRSSAVYRELAGKIQSGTIGDITVARAYRISNMFPQGIGKYPDRQPPSGFDWDMWLGPAAWRPYRENIAPYKFRWWKDYSSQVANWGVHYFDAIRWLIGEEAPASVSAQGGRYVVDDDRTVPDTLEVVYEFSSGKLLIFGQYESSGGEAVASGEIELRGTRGNLYCDERSYRIVPSLGGQFQSSDPFMEPFELPRVGEDPTQAHMANFIDCVRTRKTCHCDLETGHRSNTFALMANIALETQSRLEWDAEQERFTNNDSANDLLHYEYRKPWELA